MYVDILLHSPSISAVNDLRRWGSSRPSYMDIIEQDTRLGAGYMLILALICLLSLLLLSLADLLPTSITQGQHLLRADRPRL